MVSAPFIFPLRGKTAAQQPVGGKSGGHGFAASRGKPPSWWEGSRSVRASPGGWDSEYRFDEDERSARPLSGEPSGRGVLTRSRLRPPTGGEVANLTRTAWAISAHACCDIAACILGLMSAANGQGGPGHLGDEGHPLRPLASQHPLTPAASASRSTTPQSPSGRRPTSLPLLRGEISIPQVLQRGISWREKVSSH
jgi:hypothetical protein